jgi:hypothetical protein
VLWGVLMAQNDGMDWICERLMKHIRKTYRGHKSEITAGQLVKITSRFSLTYGIKEADMLDALIRRNWLEPIGSCSYEIHYDKMR